MQSRHGVNDNQRKPITQMMTLTKPLVPKSGSFVPTFGCFNAAMTEVIRGSHKPA